MAPAKPAFTASFRARPRRAGIAQRTHRQRHEAQLALAASQRAIIGGSLAPGLAFSAPEQFAGRTYLTRRPPPACRFACFVIQATRPAISDSGLDTGRVGLPPAKANARLPPSSISRTLGNFAASLRIAASRSGGTRWAWQSTIIQFPLLARASAIQVAEHRHLDRQRVDGNAERAQRVVDGIGDRGRRPISQTRPAPSGPAP